MQRSQGQRVDKTIPKNGYKCGSFIMECLGRPNQINLILSRPILGDFPNILFNFTIAMNTHLRAEFQLMVFTVFCQGTENDSFWGYLLRVRGARQL